MKRITAIALLEEALRNLDARKGDWPIRLIDNLYVFGSVARGASEPHDIDIIIEHDVPHEWAVEAENLRTAGRNPDVRFREPIFGRRRSFQVLCNSRQEKFQAVLLWKRGDSLETALGRLHEIPEDPSAGRAPREAMIPAFDGLDRWISLSDRKNIAAAVSTGAIQVDRLLLADGAVADRKIETYLLGRWKPTSPLYRAACAVASYWQTHGVDFWATHLHGEDTRDWQTPHFASFNLRYTRAVPVCLTEHGGVEWLEVVHPTPRGPLNCLRIKPGDREKLVQSEWKF
ncbi:nucleotidyltransferase domain-containing protein [Frankia sp. CNm7]|uniref:Nucleotidyltransferase domain-containing protein n=1 Tax=Frankia nepalensis TaxID=1836974 RepID=A0A937RN88_9ACTN|nr:nucleotidyltransferase domain-containing protein [Frankia nepalensis]MBL7500962.1 nucleotidyltransferase domain-containing protein [Frankia nepalensis]MBL7512414.1 nucleotidyltransferase domain-containing protein [Frankia nepalensis]MBL7516987.1 nucleotidyltransferase domain-containing protein [Frankia nepalensis]MBL7631975.1 nucleotidyltransferase domain-containing protein [Frankia nepalensis]